IVACGDTSSGKSSVLGALSGIPIPASGFMYTKFTTEIALRYFVKSITGHTFITSVKYTSDRHKTELESFRKDIASLYDILDLMNEARKKMSLEGTLGGQSRRVALEARRTTITKFNACGFTRSD
ncbi:uncharacterized protein A1O9_09918, partial [Exophiala aquamarina CBS 119918]